MKMKFHPATILQIMIVLLGIAALAILIYLPLTEGRAENLDLFSIYSDPLILYGYATSLLFFAVLYKTFKLLDLIKQKNIFEQNAIRILRSIRQYTIIFNVLILLAGFYIVLFHAKEDDPVGFIVICFGITFISLFAAAASKVIAAILQKGIELKSE
ncbi:DUF2975 domain-containing protein, partial [Ignavibacterium sp.]|uniref:DUF2975 domain-containing protein n=1 Tax=Ignavibacterium sp. TaxID=2651167 RepID=UPI00307F7BE4